MSAERLYNAHIVNGTETDPGYVEDAGDHYFLTGMEMGGALPRLSEPALRVLGNVGIVAGGQRAEHADYARQAA